MSKRDMIINPITGEIDLDLHRIVKGFSKGGQSLKDSLKTDTPRRTPNHPSSSHVVKTSVDGKDKMIRFGEQGASTAGKPKEGESDKMKAKRKSFKDRHAKNIAKGKSSAAYWADKVKWAEGGAVETGGPVDLARNVIGQGLLLGWGDEAEAWVRSKLGEGTYEEAVAEIRAGNEAYSEDSPYASLAGEIVGGLIPTAAALVATPFTGGASTAAASGNLARLASIGARRLGPLGTAGIVGATEGAIAGAGMAEEGGRLKGAGTGAVIGGALGTGIQKGSELAIGALNRRAANKASKIEADTVNEDRRKLLAMMAAAPVAAVLPDISKVATRKAVRALTLPKVVTSADMDVPKLSKLVTELYNKNRSNKVRPAADSAALAGEFKPITEEEFMRGNLAEVLDFIEVEKLGTRKGSTGEPADSARYYEGFSDPNLTDIAQNVEGISDVQKDALDSVFGKGWDEGVEEINLTGAADGYDNEGLSLAVRKFREETDRPIAPNIKKPVISAERMQEIKWRDKSAAKLQNRIKGMSTEDIEGFLNETYKPSYGKGAFYSKWDGEQRIQLLEELLKRKPVEQWNYNFPSDEVIKITGMFGKGPNRQLTPELDVEWMLKAKKDVKNWEQGSYGSGPPGSEMSEDEMRDFVKWAREKGVKKSPEYKAILKRRRDAKKEAKDGEGFSEGGAVYNPDLIKKNAVQLLMEADNG